MSVQRQFGVRLSVEGRLMKSHRIGEGDFEEIVITDRELLENVRQTTYFGHSQIG